MLEIAYHHIAGPRAKKLIADNAVAADHLWANRRRAPRRAAQSLTAYALTRALLSRRTGISPQAWLMRRDENGRPSVHAEGGSEIHVEMSMAHSGDLAVAAITDLGRIGIDIENCEPPRDFAELASVFGIAERQAVQHGGAGAFYRIWTLREALAKASGRGFPAVLGPGDAFADAPVERLWCQSLSGMRWVFWSGSLAEGYAFAVALQADAATLDLPKLTQVMRGIAELTLV